MSEFVKKEKNPETSSFPQSQWPTEHLFVGLIGNVLEKMTFRVLPTETSLGFCEMRGPSDQRDHPGPA